MRHAVRAGPPLPRRDPALVGGDQRSTTDAARVVLPHGRSGGPPAPAQTARCRCVGEEAARAVEREVRLVEPSGEVLEDVGRAGDDLERHVHVRRGRAGREPGGVVEQDLVGPHLDEQRRQTGQVGQERAHAGSAGSWSRDVARRRTRRRPPRRRSGRPPPWRAGSRPPSVRSTHGDMTTTAAGCGRPSSLAASSTASARPPPAESPATTSCSARVPGVEQRPVGSEAVLERCGERVLRRQPVVERVGDRARAAGQGGREPGARARGSDRRSRRRAGRAAPRRSRPAARAAAPARHRARRARPRRPARPDGRRTARSRRAAPRATGRPRGPLRSAASMAVSWSCDMSTS